MKYPKDVKMTPLEYDVILQVVDKTADDVAPTIRIKLGDLDGEFQISNKEARAIGAWFTKLGKVK